jgi:hypothetical protein
MSAFQLQKVSVESDSWYRCQSGNHDCVIVKKEKPETFIPSVKIENFDEEEFKFDDMSVAEDFSEEDEPLMVRKSDVYFNPRELPDSKNLPIQEKWFQCNFCDTKLKPRSNMMRHMKVS